jgi:mitochondrial intermediate peptidase
VFDERGLIGVMYCDLFSRVGKELSPPAHYTIRCSRRVQGEDGDDASITRDGMQLPMIALVCDFSRPSAVPSFLSWGEVETVFHEMGHAMHCIPPLQIPEQSGPQSRY